MPVHAGANWIGETLESIASECTDDIEILVIDSSPTVSTKEVVERFASRLPIQLIMRPDLKPWQVKSNLGVRLASAEHACILHQDDLWLPGRVDAARRWIALSPAAALHLAPTFFIDRRGSRLGNWTCPLPTGAALDRSFLLERLLIQNFVSVPAPVFRCDAWESCGGMDEKLWYTADWDLWLKLASSGPVIYHPEITTAFRVHGGSLTVTGSRNVDDFRSQMELVLERHLPLLAPGRRRRVEAAARASINVNVSLASASGGNVRALAAALGKVLTLGLGGIQRYLRDSRLHERVLSRLRAKALGVF